MTNWKEIKNKFSEMSGYPEEYFELVADFYIVELCAKGFSVTSISKFLELDEDEVKLILTKRLDFEGFETDLPFSPLWWREELDEINNTKWDSELIKRVVDKYYKLKERIDSYENSGV